MKCRLGRRLGSRHTGLVAVSICLATGCTSSHSSNPSVSSDQAARSALRSQQDEASANLRYQIGRSVDGRDIWAYQLGDPDSTESILVVGCVHGDEPAGIAVAQLVIRGRQLADANVLVIPNLNPDGVAAGTRQNAHGVDLNRNFPYRWRRPSARGTRYYAGTAPLSEPESRAAMTLIDRFHPQISIWFHQPYGVVDQSGGDVRIERRFSRLIGLPLERLPRYPGSITGWENHHMVGTTAFVVELPAGAHVPATARRYADAVVDFAAGV